MEPIIVRIGKAVKVPAKYNRKHDFRTDWKFIYKIPYSDSEQVFKSIGNSNTGLQIETDAQFAKWLVDNFGYGRYHIHVFKKRVSGWTFYNFDCTSKTKYFQVKKEKSFSEREREDMEKEYKKKIRELDETEVPDEKESIKDEIEEIESEIDINTLIGSDQKRNSIKIKPFKNISPVYKEHEYENYGNKDQSQKNIDNRMW